MANSSPASNFKPQWTTIIFFWATILHLITCVAMQDQHNSSQLQSAETSPRLSFIPMLPDNVEPNQNTTSILYFNGVTWEGYEYWIKKLDKFLEVYKKPNLTSGRSQNLQICDYDNPPKPGQVCQVDVKSWYPCNTDNNYDYHKGAPCMFLQLNTTNNWVPEFYNDTANLPSDMPAKLKDHIRTVPANQLNTVWVSCEGENPADIENVGPIEYIPNWGFPGYFFPHENTEGYLNPLVAIHFARPKPYLLINIECKLWAKNIKHADRADGAECADSPGLAHLHLMID